MPKTLKLQNKKSQAFKNITAQKESRKKNSPKLKIKPLRISSTKKNKIIRSSQSIALVKEKSQTYKHFSQTRVKNPLLKNSQEATFQTTLLLGGSSNFYKSESVSSKQLGFVQIVPQLNFKNGQSLNLRLFATQATDAEQKTSLLDTRVIYALKPVVDNNDVTVTFRAKTYFPTNKDKMEEEYFRSAAALNTLTVLNIPQVSFAKLRHSMDFHKNFHKWDRNQEGNKNISHFWSHNLTLLLSISSKFKFSSTGGYHLNWQYDLSKKENFLFEQEVNYQVEKNVTIAGGVTNQGSFWKNGGAESNISVFDESNSEFYGYVAYQF